MFAINSRVSINDMLRKPSPNIKTCLKPDPGYVICDVDLEQADARVVAWTSNCAKLKATFNDPTKDLHTENAKLIFGDCLGKKDPRRQKAKGGVHATNYGAAAKTLAAALQCTLSEAQAFIDTWFLVNPEIPEWHKRVRHELHSTRMIYNAFGFRRFFLGRLDQNAFNEALAWEPQSTVGILINKVWDRCATEYSGLLDVSMQVHDSLVFQFHISELQPALAAIRTCFDIPIQYPTDTLIISTGLPELSMKAWGYIHPCAWDVTRDEFLMLERLDKKARESYWTTRNGKQAV